MGEVIYVDFHEKKVIHNEADGQRFIKKVEGSLSPEDLEEFYDACLYESVYLELDPSLKMLVDQYLKILDRKPKMKHVGRLKRKRVAKKKVE